MTPDGNNENDVWIVKNIENYPVNNVSVFDRFVLARGRSC
ncbi:MAG: hypothetical protein ACPGSC_07085 [Granulosicoccaceae bacterium]